MCEREKERVCVCDQSPEELPATAAQLSIASPRILI